MAEGSAVQADRTRVGTVADLHASASRLTGLSDFGDDGYLAGLGELLGSYAADADLTPAGSKAARGMLRGALVARLLSEAAWQRYPEHADVPIERPIFVTGLPRTGTTALHRLLAADPANQGLELFLTEAPQPRPPRATWADHPLVQLIESGLRRHREEHPDFQGVHDMSASSVEECWQLLRQSMMSISFECLAHLPGYSSWLAEQDWTPAYRRHRRNLQLIGMADRRRRWVLKNPSHLFALEALLTVYPDAVVIQTHRDPVTAMASVCSLNAKASEGWSTTYRAAVVGSDQLELWARGLELFSVQRVARDREQFIDVQYDDLVADPMAVIAGIYARLGIELSVAARGEMSDLHGRSTSGARAPRHRYALADFGLTDAQVRERFAG